MESRKTVLDGQAVMIRVRVKFSLCLTKHYAMKTYERVDA
jgi:hypothetical protein